MAAWGAAGGGSPRSDGSRIVKVVERGRRKAHRDSRARDVRVSRRYGRESGAGRGADAPQTRGVHRRRLIVDSHASRVGALVGPRRGYRCRRGASGGAVVAAAGQSIDCRRNRGAPVGCRRPGRRGEADHAGLPGRARRRSEITGVAGVCGHRPGADGERGGDGEPGQQPCHPTRQPPQRRTSGDDREHAATLPPGSAGRTAARRVAAKNLIRVDRRAAGQRGGVTVQAGRQGAVGAVPGDASSAVRRSGAQVRRAPA